MRTRRRWAGSRGGSGGSVGGEGSVTPVKEGAGSGEGRWPPTGPAHDTDCLERPAVRSSQCVQACRGAPLTGVDPVYHCNVTGKPACCQCWCMGSTPRGAWRSRLRGLMPLHHLLAAGVRRLRARERRRRGALSLCHDLGSNI